MGRDRSALRFQDLRGPVPLAPKIGPPLHPLAFRHQDLTAGLEGPKPIDQKDLTNILNYINFKEEYVFAHLRHPDYQDGILLKVYPQPSLGKEVTCRWSDEALSEPALSTCQFLRLLIDDGKDILLVPATLRNINSESLTLQLPEESHTAGQRQARRYPCQDIVAELNQNGFVYKGQLVEFSPVAFRIRVRAENPSAFHWFNLRQLKEIHLRNDRQTLFTGTCRCIRQGGGGRHREIVLAPAYKEIRGSHAGKIRNPRRQLVPPPYIVFYHPLCGKRVQLEASDISTSGFSVYEDEDEASLIQGMIIPELTVNFVGGLRIECRAQVVYRLEEPGKGYRCGLAILDMDIASYTALAHLLVNSQDPHAHISNKVDMDALWEFFFDTGFIYPKKYGLIQSEREHFKKVYRRLYQECPEIARHVIYQRRGQVYAHISMVRAYERAWLIQHHAARPLDGQPAGLTVLKHIIYYLKDMHRFPSTNMGYMMVYFRPENKFPDRVFGGFARSRRNTGVCSMDLFCYLPYTAQSLVTKIPEGWSLDECSEVDLRDLNRFYTTYSGGLLMDALGLGQGGLAEESLGEIYKRLGLLRKWRVYALKHGEKLDAVLIVDQSNLGFNLSELLNSIKILVTNPEELPWNILSMAIGQLMRTYRHMEKVPVLFYPIEYVRANSIPYEKQYQLWLYDARSVGQFMEYMQRKFRFRYQ